MLPDQNRIAKGNSLRSIGCGASARRLSPSDRHDGIAHAHACGNVFGFEP